MISKKFDVFANENGFPANRSKNRAKIDGFGVCEVIRSKSQVPIIMLTALANEENQVRGFKRQIDDYVPKPFSPQILLYKIAAILRRGTEAMLLAEQIVNYNKLSECESLLKSFSEETNAVFWLEDEYGNQVYPKGKSTESTTFAGDTAITFEEEDMPKEVQAEFIGNKTQFYSIVMKNGDAYTLAVTVDLYAVRQVTDVLCSIRN